MDAESCTQGNRAADNWPIIPLPPTSVSKIREKDSCKSQRTRNEDTNNAPERRTVKPPDNPAHTTADISAPLTPPEPQYQAPPIPRLTPSLTDANTTPIGPTLASTTHQHHIERVKPHPLPNHDQHTHPSLSHFASAVLSARASGTSTTPLACIWVLNTRCGVEGAWEGA